MRKSIALFGTMLLFTMFISVGCNMFTELKAQQENQAIKLELETTKEKLEDLKSRWDSFNKVAALEYYLVGYWSNTAKGDTQQIEQMTAKMITYIQPIGDQILDTLWQQALTAKGNNQHDLFEQSLAALMDRNSKLFNDRAKLVNDALIK